MVEKCVAQTASPTRGTLCTEIGPLVVQEVRQEYSQESTRCGSICSMNLTQKAGKLTHYQATMILTKSMVPHFPLASQRELVELPLGDTSKYLPKRGRRL